MKNILRMVFAVVGMCGVLCAATSAQNKIENIASILPDPGELGLWRQVDSVRLFAGEDLFTFIDGGADIYFEYGFQQVISAEYQNSNRISIKLEIYEMKDTAAAYGIYSMNEGTQGKTVRVGNEGVLNEYYCVFWKDKYLTFISSDDTTGETLEGILTVAESVDGKIQNKGKRPGLTTLLPQQGLIGCRYVRGLIGLSSIYDFDTKNIFNVREGVAGIYNDHTVFIFKYNSENDAKMRYDSAREVLKRSTKMTNFKDEVKRYSLTDRKGSHLCITHAGNLVVTVIAAGESDIEALCEGVVSSVMNPH